MKVVVNRCFGGFGISIKAAEFMAKRGNKVAAAELKYYRKRQKEKKKGILKLSISTAWFGYGYSKKYTEGYSRTDPDLIAAVEQLGSEEASGNCSSLEVVEIPDGMEYYIDDYDGHETIHEAHRSW